MAEPDSWEEVAAAPMYTTLREGRDGEFAWMIRRGPLSLNGYVGVPKDHPLAGWSYQEFPLDVHFGLNWPLADRGRDVGDPAFWWYGWSYDHVMSDRILLRASAEQEAGHPIDWGRPEPENFGIRWTVPMVKADIETALAQVRRMAVVTLGDGTRMVVPTLEDMPPILFGEIRGGDDA